MTIEEMKEHEWIVSWSGGKDSTATIILMHENKIPIKEIIYVRMMYDESLPATLPVMTDFVDNSKKIFEDWGYKVTIVPSIRSAKDISEKRFYRSKYTERNGKKYGLSNFSRGRCKMTGAKTDTIAKLIKERDPDAYEMIGYAADETKRIHRLSERKQSIMVELGIKEKDTFDICRKYNLLSPLYDLGISRDGCFFCPNAKKLEREYIHEHYPELVKKIYKLIEEMDYKCSELPNNWLKDYTDHGNKFTPAQIGRSDIEDKDSH